MANNEAVKLETTVQDVFQPFVKVFDKTIWNSNPVTQIKCCQLTTDIFTFINVICTIYTFLQNTWSILHVYRLTFISGDGEDAGGVKFAASNHRLRLRFNLHSVLQV